MVIETQGKSLAVLLKNETILSASVCIISTTMSNYNSPTFPLSVYLSVYIYIAIDFYSYWRWDLLEVLALWWAFLCWSFFLRFAKFMLISEVGDGYCSRSPTLSHFTTFEMNSEYLLHAYIKWILPLSHCSLITCYRSYETPYICDRASQKRTDMMMEKIKNWGGRIVNLCNSTLVTVSATRRSQTKKDQSCALILFVESIF